MDEIAVTRLAVEVMERRGYSVVRDDSWIKHPDSGFVIKPDLVRHYPSGSSIGSVSVMTTYHPRLIPNGVFEYQHGIGGTLSDALREGFDQWVQIDFAVLLAALRDPLEYCNAIEFTLPQKDGPGLRRRAVLGPVGHRLLPPNRMPSEGEHSFCPCCFLTNNYEAFRPLMESDGFYGIRLFAARDDSGAARADCRVNGKDWEDGMRALLGYVETWPQAGLEFRKQYVVMQTLSAPTVVSASTTP